MTQLDEVWTEMIGRARDLATEAGDHDLADYLRLKATNDAIRSRGVAWLFETIIHMAAEQQRHRHGLIIEREEPYSFKRGNSNIVGSAVIVRQGVRCLTAAAGWVRTPSDGVMSKGALAYARFVHFGMPRSGEELRLYFGDDLPKWQTEEGAVVDASRLRRHLEILFD